MKYTWIIFIPLIALSCSVKPLKPGTSSVRTSDGGMNATMNQSENPSQGSSQHIDESINETVLIPLGSTNELNRLHDDNENFLRSIAAVLPNYSAVPKSSITNRNGRDFMVLTRTTTRKVGTDVGAAQKDTAREIGAKLKAVAWISWVGIAILLGGIFTFTPYCPPMPVRVRVMICAAGGALIVAPMIIVGNEKWILLAIAVGGLAWFLIEKSHEMNSERAYLQGKLDANNDGVDDRTPEFVVRVKTATTSSAINAILLEAKEVLDDVDYATVKAAADARRLEIQ